jgi:RNase H-like domain found in reverse transcriptase
MPSRERPCHERKPSFAPSSDYATCTGVLCPDCRAGSSPKQLPHYGEPPVLGELSEAARKAFEALRQKLLSPPVSALTRRDGHLWLDTDASDAQLRSCLLQEQPSGPALPLGYWSRTLSAAERNNSTTEKECLATV